MVIGILMSMLWDVQDVGDVRANLRRIVWGHVHQHCWSITVRHHEMIREGALILFCIGMELCLLIKICSIHCRNE